MKRYVVNRSEIESARDIRRKFYDQEPNKKTPMPWEWPRHLQEVGVCEAVMYTSDKWHRRFDFEDYKHRKEGPQYVLVRKNFVVDYFDPKTPIPMFGPSVELDKMPRFFAVLAPILGIQVCLYDSYDGDSATLSRDWHQIDIPRAKLGAAEHPVTGDTFLFVYTEKHGVLTVIVGDELGVEKDGIVG